MDVNFELRHGEAVQFVDGEDAPYRMGRFPIPEPGPLGKVSGTDDPVEPFALVVASRRGDHWAYMKLGAGTHFYMCEALREHKLDNGAWHDFKIV